MTKHQVMKSLSSVCTSSLSLKLGLHCNMSTASLSLPAHLSTCCALIGVSPSPYILFAGSPGLTMSVTLCRYLRICCFFTCLCGAYLQTVPPKKRQKRRKKIEKRATDSIGLITSEHPSVGSSLNAMNIFASMCVY